MGSTARAESQAGVGRTFWFTARLRNFAREVSWVTGTGCRRRTPQRRDCAHSVGGHRICSGRGRGWTSGTGMRGQISVPINFDVNTNAPHEWAGRYPRGQTVAGTCTNPHHCLYGQCLYRSSGALHRSRNDGLRYQARHSRRTLFHEF